MPGHDYIWWFVCDRGKLAFTVGSHSWLSLVESIRDSRLLVLFGREACVMQCGLVMVKSGRDREVRHICLVVQPRSSHFGGAI